MAEKKTEVGTNELIETIFNNVDRLLSKRGKTSAWLTRKVKATPGYFSPSYHKRIDSITLKKVLLIADGLDCSLYDLIADDAVERAKKEKQGNPFKFLTRRQCESVLSHAFSYLDGEDEE